MTLMQVTLASRRSPDASGNEDFIAATANMVVVIDGASVPPGLATGCVHGTAWFARRLGAQLLALLSANADQSPSESLAQAIIDVAALHADTCDLGHPGSPSATVAILREQPETIDCLVLGDTTVLLEQPNGLHRATVLSDGATRLVDRFGLLDWPSLLTILAEQGPEAIIQQVRAAEGSDPDGQRWPRGKRHDDASAALCHLTLGPDYPADRERRP